MGLGAPRGTHGHTGRDEQSADSEHGEEGDHRREGAGDEGVAGGLGEDGDRVHGPGGGHEGPACNLPLEAGLGEGEDRAEDGEAATGHTGPPEPEPRRVKHGLEERGPHVAHEDRGDHEPGGDDDGDEGDADLEGVEQETDGEDATVHAPRRSCLPGVLGAHPWASNGQGGDRGHDDHVDQFHGGEHAVLEGDGVRAASGDEGGHDGLCSGLAERGVLVGDGAVAVRRNGDAGVQEGGDDVVGDGLQEVLRPEVGLGVEGVRVRVQRRPEQGVRDGRARHAGAQARSQFVVNLVEHAVLFGGQVVLLDGLGDPQPERREVEVGGVGLAALGLADFLVTQEPGRWDAELGAKFLAERDVGGHDGRAPLLADAVVLCLDTDGVVVTLPGCPGGTGVPRNPGGDQVEAAGAAHAPVAERAREVGAALRHGLQRAVVVGAAGGRVVERHGLDRDKVSVASGAPAIGLGDVEPAGPEAVGDLGEAIGVLHSVASASCVSAAARWARGGVLPARWVRGSSGGLQGFDFDAELVERGDREAQERTGRVAVLGLLDGVRDLREQEAGRGVTRRLDKGNHRLAFPVVGVELHPGNRGQGVHVDLGDVLFQVRVGLVLDDPAEVGVAVVVVVAGLQGVVACELQRAAAVVRVPDERGSVGAVGRVGDLNARPVVADVQRDSVGAVLDRERAVGAQGVRVEVVRLAAARRGLERDFERALAGVQRVPEDGGVVAGLEEREVVDVVAERGRSEAEVGAPTRQGPRGGDDVGGHAGGGAVEPEPERPADVGEKAVAAQDRAVPARNPGGDRYPGGQGAGGNATGVEAGDRGGLGGDLLPRCAGPLPLSGDDAASVGLEPGVTLVHAVEVRVVRGVDDLGPAVGGLLGGERRLFRVAGGVQGVLDAAVADRLPGRAVPPLRRVRGRLVPDVTDAGVRRRRRRVVGRDLAVDRGLGGGGGFEGGLDVGGGERLPGGPVPLVGLAGVAAIPEVALGDGRVVRGRAVVGEVGIDDAVGLGERVGRASDGLRGLLVGQDRGPHRVGDGDVLAVDADRGVAELRPALDGLEAAVVVGQEAHEFVYGVSHGSTSVGERVGTGEGEAGGILGLQGPSGDAAP
ncbi:hypothetical protein Q3G72_017694 [Acer saccharum]|nr:hypothetical protein Q3G72_017694 [Acer saccharum]